jgi:hypothetical protein
MNTSQLKILIKYLQCKQGKFAKKVADKISLGICSQELLDKLTISSYLLEVFYRYKTYTSDITNAQKLTINTETSATLDIDLEVGGLGLGNYIGVGSRELILDFYFNYINANTSTTNYYAVRIEDSLYIYSFSNLESFADTLEIVFLTVAEVEYTTESLENNTSELMNLINCLTVCNLSNLKNKFLQIIQI